MKHLQLLGIFCLLSAKVNAQTPDSLKSYPLGPVTVTAFKEEPLSETSLNITPLSIDSLSHYGTYNLSELMSKTPGVSMLSTGPAIAKPVIRGLYGNRVLVLLSGLKFDNQQWQEEHGLGLSEMGLSRIELIKGPMSVLYGSEAIGGIINLVEEDKAEAGHSESDFGIKFNSNTLGGLVQAGYKQNSGKNWFRLRIGVENNADYSDGNDKRVLNSRFDAYYLKTSFGFLRKNWISNNHYSFSYNRFGFIFNDIYEFVSPDDRWSRSLSKNPAHFVMLHILSSENSIQLKDSKLTVNAGFQSNQRMENEGGGKISLNMQLLTAQYLVKWEKKINEDNRIILSNLGSVEQNTNFGSRKIVPNAQMQESNIAVYLETDLKERWNLENGIGIGEKMVNTTKTNSVNTPDKDLRPFNKFASYYNAFTGVSFVPNANVNIKANIATGVRIPNLAELSSDGLHEGVFTYEIGNPDLKNEQNLAFNLLMNYTAKKFDISLSPFYNHFLNYVYLAPTTETFVGFPVLRYKQQDANQYGSEFNLAIRPTTKLSINNAFSAMVSKTADGAYTPYIPAAKWSPGLSYTLTTTSKRKIQVYSSADYCFAQKNTAANELSTGDYFLLNAGISTNFECRTSSWTLGLNGNNLLDRAYYDHMSRFKYFGLLNMGRNITLQLNVRFHHSSAK